MKSLEATAAAWLLQHGKLLAAVIALSVALHAAADAAETKRVMAGLDVTLWQPDAPTSAALPVVIFSHGFHGCATQSRFLTTAIAAAGYIVVAANHADAVCDGGKARWIDEPEVSFGQPDAWTKSTYRGRADDIRRLIVALHGDAALNGRIDWQRLGLAGHSLGGYTVLSLGGAQPSWKIDGVKAVLALSPYVPPLVMHGTLGALAAPVMYQGGTLDVLVTPWVSKAGGAYDLSPAPKYFVDMRDAGHLAWADIDFSAHQTIVDYSIMFLDRYLRDRPADKRLTNAAPGVADLRADIDGKSDGGKAASTGRP